MKSNWLAGTIMAGACLGAVGAASAAVTLSPIASTQVVTFKVFLPLQNQAVLATTLKALQTKGSPQFRKWLTPAQIQAQFLPTAA
jgi:pseudomonalisin